MSEEIDKRILLNFEIIQKLRKTQSAVLWKAIDRISNQVVVIKKLNYQNTPSTILLQNIREMLILLDMPMHENIVQLKEIMEGEEDKAIYAIEQYVDVDLSTLIKVDVLQDVEIYIHQQILQEHKNLILFQIICALDHLHQYEIAHTDLAPGKILIDSECQTKIIGLGQAQYINKEISQHLNDYTLLRWYRAPEILLGANNLTGVVDVWSLGCIYGEMLCGQPLFPGTSTLNQLEKIIELIGKPQLKDILEMGGPMTQSILSAVQIVRKKTFAQVFPQINLDSLELLKKMLVFNPKDRMSLDEILQSPSLSHLYTIFKQSKGKKLKSKMLLPESKTSSNNYQFLTLKEYREQLSQFIGIENKPQRKENNNQGIQGQKSPKIKELTIKSPNSSSKNIQSPQNIPPIYPQRKKSLNQVQRQQDRPSPNMQTTKRNPKLSLKSNTFLDTPKKGSQQQINQ